MPYRKTQFEKNQPLHLVSRAVAQTKIFENDSDCYRFIFQMQAANLGRPAPNAGRKDLKRAVQRLFRGRQLDSSYIKKEHDPLVHIFDFALVQNHYHLYLVPNKTNSVIPFMQRLNLGFAKYFNLKHKRKGTLFSGPYKTRLVRSQTHSDTVQRYISLVSPLDIYQPMWREEGLSSKDEALNFLKDYEFSSFPDNIGQRNSAFLAASKVREKYNITQGEMFLDSAKHFIKSRTARNYLGISLE